MHNRQYPEGQPTRRVYHIHACNWGPPRCTIYTRMIYAPFSHEIGLDRQQIYARQDNNMRACVIQPKSNHTPLHRNARALAISLPAFHPATPPRLASIGQVKRSWHNALITDFFAFFFFF